MARINLLPWREELRARKKKEFFAYIGIAAAASALVLVLVHVIYASRIDAQGLRNAFLQGEIGKLEKKIEDIKVLEKERDRLLSRMKAIEKLQSARPLIVHLFDELVTTLPEGVYLTSMKQSNKDIVLEGVARSNARVSNFMRNLEASDYLEDAKLDVVKNAEGKGGRNSKEFVLKISQTLPKSEEEQDAKGAKGKGPAKPAAKPPAKPAEKK